jgi:hypothetical protein
MAGLACVVAWLLHRARALLVHSKLARIKLEKYRSIGCVSFTADQVNKPRPPERELQGATLIRPVPP